jgi:hypothetical protein
MYEAYRQIEADHRAALVREAATERLARATRADADRRRIPFATFLQRTQASVSVRWSTRFDRRRTPSPTL